MGWVTATEAHVEEADPYCSLSNCANSNAFAASEKKCEEQGARLANLAEIKIATNNNLYNADTTVFSSERASSSSYYGMDKNGNVGTMYLYFTYRHVICVGND